MQTVIYTQGSFGRNWMLNENMQPRDLHTRQGYYFPHSDMNKIIYPQQKINIYDS